MHLQLAINLKQHIRILYDVLDQVRVQLSSQKLKKT